MALDGVSFDLRAKESLGIIGESGSGKTTLARVLVRLVQADAGRMFFASESILSAGSASLREIRRRMQLIYQDPFSSLNPRLTVHSAIAEPARFHGLITRHDEQDFVDTLLDDVGLPKYFASYRPHQLSGGQRQRVAIARALSVRPDVLLADEPVSALDVSIQGQILNLLEKLRQERGLTTLIISHQLNVVSHVAHRVIVMYLGRVVEEGTTEEVFYNPQHPYTVALLAAHPSLSGDRRAPTPLKGEIPSPSAIPSGCRFRTRCPIAEPECALIDPPAVSVSVTHRSWCLFADASAQLGNRNDGIHPMI